MLHRSLFLFPLLLASSLALAGTAVRHVSPSGEDSGDCLVNSCLTIVYALDQAGVGDTIQLASGMYQQTDPDGLTIDRSITIRGQSRGSTFIVADAVCGFASNRVIQISSPVPTLTVRIEDLTISGGVAEGSGAAGRGGGLYIEHTQAEVYVDNVRFNCNQARVGGGILALHDPKLEIVDSLFTHNFASQRGGAVYNATGTRFLVDATQFEANSAGSSGGAVYSDFNVGVQIEGSIFLNNSADELGCGALCIQGEFTENFVRDTQFYDNSAGASGGALFLRESSPVLEHLHFSQNQALGSGMTQYGGGAIYMDQDSAPVLRDIKFIDNHATNWGGAIQIVEAGLVSLSDIQLEDNQAGLCGGGINVQQ